MCFASYILHKSDETNLCPQKQGIRLYLFIYVVVNLEFYGRENTLLT